jgi:hypothetical protein
MPSQLTADHGQTEMLQGSGRYVCNGAKKLEKHQMTLDVL